MPAKMYLLHRVSPANEFLGIYTNQGTAIGAALKLDPEVRFSRDVRTYYPNPELVAGLWRITPLDVNPRYDHE